MSQQNKTIDVRELLKQHSIEDLNRFAEEYFAREHDWGYYLAKPFGAIDEAPQLLIQFGVTLQGLALFRGASVLEFGAGTCWASRYLTQLGCRVIALDVSPTALKIGQELYRRQPVSGEQPEPTFLLFDGHKIDLPDESVDRIICLDAFHHVPNPREVLLEFGRVLKVGGIAGLAEPGPSHSQSPQSQDEMKTFKVIENDINMVTIWKDARDAGFTDLKLAVFNVPPVHLSLSAFDELLEGGLAGKSYCEAVINYLKNQRTFFLFKGKTESPDSRFREGLNALIEVRPSLVKARAAESIKVWATVTNNSKAVWLPRSAGVGAVQLGCHVYDSEGQIYHHSFHWEVLTPGEGRRVLPNETLEVEVNLPPLPTGNYILEFDMVSYQVSWFARNGSPTDRINAAIE